MVLILVSVLMFNGFIGFEWVVVFGGDFVYSLLMCASMLFSSDILKRIWTSSIGLKGFTEFVVWVMLLVWFVCLCIW